MNKPSEFTSHADRVLKRIGLAREGKRKSVTIEISLPEDLIEDLKDIAAARGYKRYESLARSYIGRGIRDDLMRLDNLKVDLEDTDAGCEETKKP